MSQPYTLFVHANIFTSISTRSASNRGSTSSCLNIAIPLVDLPQKLDSTVESVQTFPFKNRTGHCLSRQQILKNRKE
jgi:hypothetical protein